MNNDDFLFSSSKKASIRVPSLKELVLNQSVSSSAVCKNISTLPNYLKRFGQGGSSWTIYSISTDPNLLLKYVDFDSFKSQDIGRSKARMGTYLKHIESELKVNMLLKENKENVQNILVPIEIGTCDTDDEPYFIILNKCDKSLDKALEILGDLNVVKKIIIDVIVGLKSLQALGIIHNDLEPRNILLKKNDVYISDFGISAIRSEIEDELMFYDIAMFLSYLYLKNRVVTLDKLEIDLTKMPGSIAEDLFLKYKTLDGLVEKIQNL